MAERRKKRLPHVPVVVLLTFYTALAQWVPKYSYSIDCGSPLNTTSSDTNQKWQGESVDNPTFTSAGIPVNTSTQNPNLPSQIPYLTARVFASRSNYTFPVDPGRYWLRLYFYPIPAGGFDPAQANFSVLVGSYTLMSGNPIESRAYTVEEYSLFVDRPQLVLVFDPATPNGSFAYVNAIQLMSMPEDALEDDAILVGQGQTKFGFTHLALQTMYRLNVGGASVNVANDSQHRPWSTDQSFLEGAASGSPTQDMSAEIKYTKDVPVYIAPASVYGTGRVLGVSNTVNNNFRVSWRLPVDSNFYYLIRLHFAELNFDKTYQRIFNVYINNLTALDGMDLIALGPKYTAIYRDFVVNGGGSLRVQIGPTPNANSQYSDAILNGLEVFKMNNTAGSLSQPEVGGGGGSSGGNSKATGAIVGAVVGGTAVAAVVIACLFVLCRKATKTHGKLLSPRWRPGLSPAWRHAPSTSVASVGSPRSVAASHYSTTPANLCRHFTLQQIVDATNNFDELLLLGVGGFGKVYKGELEGGVKVAVKRGNPMSEQGLREFETEIEMLSKLRHRHLVSLIGYCDEDSEMILIYDYMANGPLRGHLYGPGSEASPLTWKQRLDICIGAARGLHYLHTGQQRAIIHRDVKTTNILLDEKFVAKVSDFGLSKVGPSLEHTHVSTAVKGSFGYLDPEYFRRQMLTEKSDVYSFGVVLMEVLCARPAINPALPREQVNIAEWALHWQRLGVLENIMDPKLSGDITEESLHKFGDIAERCLADRGSDRPTIGDVLWNLEHSLQLHESVVRHGMENGSGENGQTVEMPLRSLHQPSSDDQRPDSSHVAYSDAEDASASVVFSQLVNPQGR